ncbi:MAG: hypothetical protein U0900_15980 [Myxococcota bacterium]
MRHTLAFLWHERGAWHAELPYGPTGSGATPSDALDALHEAQLERRREVERRPPSPPADEATARLLATLRKSTPDATRSVPYEIERLGLDDCLPIAPDAFAALLAEQCERRTPRELRAVRRIIREFGREEPRPVSGLTAHPVGAWLRRHRILVVGSELYDLPISSHWTPERSGLFAFDGSTLHRLEESVEALQTMLQAEQPDLAAVDPSDIAHLVIEAVGRRGNAHHTLATVDSLERMEEPGWYVLDRRELARISPLPEASLETSPEGWILRFATRFGELGMDDEVYEWRVAFSRRFEVEIRLDLLSSRIFASRPIVME